MNRRQFFGLGVASLTALAASCSSTVPGVARQTSTPSVPTPTGPSSPTGELRGTGARMAAAQNAAAATNINRFAADLFRAALPGTPNAVMSPYSVLAALGMTAFGARGDAASALSTVLGADAVTIAAQITAADAALDAAVQAGNVQKRDRTTSEFAIEAANRLFAQSGLLVRPEFLDALATGYDAAMQSVDFKADPAAARALINAWVADKTRKLIPNLLPEAAVNPDTRLVLVNALYLKAPWAQEFSQTDDDTDFATADGRSVTVRRMRLGEVTLPMGSGDGWTSVSIPYHGDKLAMTLVVPDAGQFARVAEKLDGAMLTAAVAGADTLMNLEVPAFSVDSPTSLTAALSALGLGPLFNGDLSGIAGAPGDLIVADVIHQAKVTIDIHGTEAAAATAVIGVGGAAPPGDEPKPVEFMVDRAFLYTIHDTATGCPLFLGRVSDPTA